MGFKEHAIPITSVPASAILPAIFIQLSLGAAAPEADSRRKDHHSEAKAKAHSPPACTTPILTTELKSDLRAKLGQDEGQAPVRSPDCMRKILLLFLALAF